MGSCLPTAVCCCCGICCNQIIDALTKLLGTERLTKIYYFVLLIIFVVPAIFVFFFLYNWISFKQFFSKWFHCPSDEGFECIGASAIYRLSLSLLGFFLMMALFMLCRNKCAQVLNQGLFIFKYLIVIGALIGFLFVSNSIFEGYAIAAKYISIVYMVLQSIILIDLFYLMPIKWVKKYEEGKSQYAGCLIFWTIFFYAVAIFLNVFGYIQFSSSENGQCTSLTWVNVLTSIIIVALPLFQICQFNPQNNVLTASLVSLYVSFLTFIAQYSYDGLCKRITTASFAVDISISTFIYIVTMYGSIMGGSGQVKVTSNGDLNKSIGVAPKTNKEMTNIDQDNQQKNTHTNIQFNQRTQNGKQSDEISEAQKYTHSWSWFKWHLYMCFASIYVAVLITNWNSANIITKSLESSGFSFWVRVAVAWGTVIIYIWTIIAPKVLPQRDFRIQ